jgi:hypothetical protein
MPRKVTSKPVRAKASTAPRLRKRLRSATPSRRRPASFTAAEWYSQAAASVAVKPGEREA